MAGPLTPPTPTPVVAIVGPTATGKSDLAIELARITGGEVVNADSMQLYRGMDVGTAKVTDAERRGVTHHLLDIWPVTQTASVAEYQHRARTVIDALKTQQRQAIVVGGSGLYVRAALDKMEFPGTDPQLRKALEHELESVGAQGLHARLESKDPAAAAAILPTNGRRIVRALEVVELTGRPYTASLPSYEGVYDVTYIGLDLDDAALDERVNARVDRMFARGLVDEVRRLDTEGLRHGLTASRALGYQQVLALLDGKLTAEQAMAQTKTATRRFVRRQRSWFRRDPRVRWLDASQPKTVLAQEVLTAQN